MGFGAGKGSNPAQPADTSLRFNTANQGKPIPLVYGVNRVSGNVFWYGDFQSYFQSSGSSGGKGGLGGGKGGSSGTYTYSASFMIGICEGPIAQILTVWQDKNVISQASTTGATVAFTGTIPATVPTVPAGGIYELPFSGVLTSIYDDTASKAITIGTIAYGINGATKTPPAGPNVCWPLNLGSGAPSAPSSNASYELEFSSDLAGHSITISYSGTEVVQEPISDMTFFNGTATQTAWSYLETSYPTQALNYRGLAYGCSANFGLGESTELPQFSFEVVGLFANSVTVAGNQTATLDEQVPDSATIQVVPAGSSLFLEDGGVVLTGNGIPLTSSAIPGANDPFPPGPMQYAVNSASLTTSDGTVTYSPGTYFFSPDLIGEPVAIKFSFTGLAYTPDFLDANPADVVTDFLTNAVYGVGIPAAWVGPLATYRAYCAAQELLVSPAWSDQDQASSMMDDLVKYTNAEWIFTSGQLSIQPRGDVALSANGAAYTPPSPLYSLGDDDFIYKSGEDPVKLDRKRPSDNFNVETFEFNNRYNQYNRDIVEAKDQGAIDLFGLRPDDTQTVHFFCDPQIAATAAWLYLYRLTVRNSYSFRLGWKYILLDPMDIVEITDANLGLAAQTVRITEIAEDEDGTLQVTAEEVLQGTGTAALYSFHQTVGYQPNYGQPPGAMAPPLFFEPPLALSQSGNLEVWMALSGASAAYGGTDIWVSFDGSSYAFAGRAKGSARQGILTQAFPSFTFGQATAAAQLFASGDGTTASFQLQALMGASLVAITSVLGAISVFKSDWQGNQLQYATARSNLLEWSQSFGTSPWSISGSLAITTWSGGNAPDGTATAQLLTPSVTTDSVLQMVAVPNDSSLYMGSVFINAASVSTDVRLALNLNGGTQNQTDVIFDPATGLITGTGGTLIASGVIAYPNGWYLVWLAAANNSSGNTVATVRLRPDNSATSSAIYWGAQLTNITLDSLPSTGPSSYIATAGAPVTVTDYALGAAGIVTFAAAPGAGAALSWSGTGTYGSGSPSGIDTTDQLTVGLTSYNGQLLSGTQLDANLNNTLCWVDGELVSYADAQLLADSSAYLPPSGSAIANIYGLTYLTRGQYGTAAGAHNAGAPFARLDSAIFTLPITPSYIGAPVWIKLLPYNQYGGGQPNLADVVPYNYKITGIGWLSPLANVGGLSASVGVNGAPIISWLPVTDPLRSVDYEIRFGASWQNGQVLGRTPSTTFGCPSDGTYWVAAHARSPQGVDVYSASPASILQTLPTVPATSLFSETEESVGWPGTLGGGAVRNGTGVSHSLDLELNASGNLLTVANILATSDVLWLGGVQGSGSYIFAGVGAGALGLDSVVSLLFVFSYTLTGVSIYGNLLTVPDFLAWTDVFGASLGAKVSVTPQIAFDLSGGGPPAWQNWTLGKQYNCDYSVTGDTTLLSAQILLASSDPQVRAVLSHLALTIYALDQTQSAEAEPISATGSGFAFLEAFNAGPTGSAVPNVQVTIHGAQSGDTAVITSRSIAGFTVQILNGGSGVARTVDWLATGF